MISLRQHAISLAAVFLALAIGVVLGSGFLSGAWVSGLRDEAKNLHGQINSLNDQKNALNEKLSSANAFDTQLAGRMVHDALNGKSVIIFRTPDASNDDVDAVSRIIGQSGGAVTGTVSLTQEFVDANSAEKLRSVVNSSILPAGAQLSTKLVDQGSQAGDLLGIALLINRDPAVPTVDDTQRDTVLAALVTPALSGTATSTSAPRMRRPSSPAVAYATTPAMKASAWHGSPPPWHRMARVCCSPAATARRAGRRPSR